MRLLLVILALGVAMLGSGQADVDTDLNRAMFWAPGDQIERSVLQVANRAPTGGPGAPLLDDRVAAVALAFAPRISRDTMPILPDIPEPTLAPWQDAPVQASLAPPGPIQAGRFLDAAPKTSVATNAQPEPEADPLPERTAGKFLRPPKSNAQITGNRLALRTGPAKRFASVGSLFVGDKVRITGAQQGGYVPVVAENGQSGWVFHSYVSRKN